jgi:hypothetical protein
LSHFYRGSFLATKAACGLAMENDKSNDRVAHRVGMKRPNENAFANGSACIGCVIPMPKEFEHTRTWWT